MLPPTISLFSGAGGLDIGLEQAGYETRVCVEWEETRCATLKQNRPHWAVINGDIRKFSTKQILAEAGLKKGEAALVVGGPPCQAFSKSAFWVPGRIESILDDPRAHLLKEYVRVVKDARPRAFIMENVFGLAYKTSRPALDATIHALSSEGYVIAEKVVNAADYGVPQRRERLLLVGVLGGPKFHFPPPTHAPPDRVARLTEMAPYVTAGDAIGDLDDGNALAGEVIGGKYGHLLEMIPPGENYLHLTAKKGHKHPLFEWRSKYWSFLLKLSPDQPSWTIQASPGPYVGPFHWRNRRLRIPEVKRIQTFPDDWQLAGSRSEQWAQIGDAVPCLLAERIGHALREQVFDAPLQVKHVTKARRPDAQRRRRATKQLDLGL